MIVTVEFRTAMSRRELAQALRIIREAATRLSHRMDEADLDRLEACGAALIAIANAERRALRERLIDGPIIDDLEYRAGPQ